MTVKIKATFKKDERAFNGLSALEKELIEEPLTRHVVVGIVETSKVVRDVEDGGTESPTIRFVQLEPLEGESAVEARRFLAEAYAKRTGNQDTLFEGADEGNGGEG